MQYLSEIDKKKHDNIQLLSYFQINLPSQSNKNNLFYQNHRCLGCFDKVLARKPVDLIISKERIFDMRLGMKNVKQILKMLDVYFNGIFFQIECSDEQQVKLDKFVTGIFVRKNK